MQLRNTRNGYGALARALHWWMAALMIGLIGLGLFMTAQPDGDPKWALYDLHKSLGVLAFSLLLIRIVWRRITPPPPLPISMNGLEAFAAHAGHLLLSAAMVALPLTGYLDSAFGGYHISVFGLFDIPMLFEKNKTLFDLTVQAHRWIGWSLGLLVLAHAGAALKHHFIQRDDVLLRMLKDRPD
mgnify:CR=1 FL=1